MRASSKVEKERGVVRISEIHSFIHSFIHLGSKCLLAINYTCIYFHLLKNKERKRCECWDIIKLAYYLTNIPMRDKVA